MNKLINQEDLYMVSKAIQYFINTEVLNNEDIDSAKEALKRLKYLASNSIEDGEDHEFNTWDYLIYTGLHRYVEMRVSEGEDMNGFYRVLGFLEDYKF